MENSKRTERELINKMEKIRKAKKKTLNDIIEYEEMEQELEQIYKKKINFNEKGDK